MSRLSNRNSRYLIEGGYENRVDVPTIRSVVCRYMPEVGAGGIWLGSSACMVGGTL